MNLRTRAAWLGSLGVAAAAMMMLMLLGGCRNRTAQQEAQPEAQAKPAAAAITVENGQTFITLDAPTQKRLGFTVATLTSKRDSRPGHLPRRGGSGAGFGDLPQYLC